MSTTGLLRYLSGRRGTRSARVLDFGHTESELDVIEAERRRLQRDPSFGLALSGGGMRAACFALGLLQTLARAGVLAKVDYLSTVSGGGYIGSALTWWFNQGLPQDLPNADTQRRPAGTSAADFPLGAMVASATRPSSPGPAPRDAILDFLRFNSNYLLPGKQFGVLSVLALTVRNIVVSLAIHISFLSVVMSAILAAFTVAFSSQPSEPSHTPPFGGYCIVCPSWVDTLVPPGTPSQPVAFAFLTSVLDLVVYLLGAFAVLSAISALSATPLRWIRRCFPRVNWDDASYWGRRTLQSALGRLLTLALLGVLLAAMSAIYMLSDPPVLPVLALVVLSAFLVFMPPVDDGSSRQGRPERIRRLFGACLFLFALVFASFAIAVAMVSEPIHWSRDVLDRFRHAGHPVAQLRDLGPDLLVMIYWLSGLVLLVSFSVLGVLTNVNAFGIHQMYRDRLMELFLPDEFAVIGQEWKPADGANTALIEDMCQQDDPGPYHLINANVVLVDSTTRKFRERGGDNFVFSPLYCGSAATGWRRTGDYMKRSGPGITLATAMAISGAAVNPNTAAAGADRTGSRLISVVMSMLGLRLGYWAPNPNPHCSGGEQPNFIRPGVTWTFSKRALHERNSILDLTDGGHFENLGLYELVRRELETIVVCDGSEDPDGELASLANAVERVRVDFRADVTFPDPQYGIARLAGDAPRGHPDQSPAGVAIGHIRYENGSEGRLIYVRPARVRDGSPEFVAQSRGQGRFPHDSTADQFFGESQFEAYRELGACQAKGATRHILTGAWLEGRWTFDPPEGAE